MLTELRIENFAIIEHLEIKFAPGLVTLTGETGAGKSIILDALLALLGGRTDATSIRSGADRAVIDATFQLSDENRSAVHDILKREDLLDDEDYLTMNRELRREGRSTARVNGHSANLNLLRELGSYLVDIHGQSEHLSLLNVRQHLSLLDRFASDDDLLAAYQQTYHHLQKVLRELNALRLSEQEANRMLELYQFQVKEIESANLHPDEEESLRQERDRLANAENLTASVQQCLALLEEGGEGVPAISEQIGKVVQSLSVLARLDPSQESLHDSALTLEEQLSDLALKLQGYLDEIEFNPRRLEQVEERLALINTLKRKYGGDIPAVLAYARDARTRLDNIAHAGERIAELEEEQQEVLDVLSQQGQKLSQMRHAASVDLQQAVEAELADLNMSGAGFKVEIGQQPDPKGIQAEGGVVAYDENGIDQVEFLIAPNPGEGFKPLVKIASGGETSRLMLALKNVLAQADHIPTLIFDEIDQGIGGRAGIVVGEKLWKLARRHQVLCVTHLPQLAAFGDQHLGIRKKVELGRTRTLVEPLSGAARLDELATMLGSLSDVSRDAAKETLDLARQRAAAMRG
jgi:DNA repair protein RecN (Recombination protein N)